jgi:cytosine deaminase
VAVHQLVVAAAVLRDRSGRWQIGIDDGRISTVTQTPLTGREEVDAAGGLVTESFVDAHLHHDKVHTLDRLGDAALTAYTSGDLGSARRSIDLASAVKAEYDRSWIEPNARRAVLQAVRYGVRHVLAFADVDTSARLEGVIPLLALREEFRGVVDLQVVAFPQDGLLCDPGAEELVREAVDLGAVTYLAALAQALMNGAGADPALGRQIAAMVQSFDFDALRSLAAAIGAGEPSGR